MCVSLKILLYSRFHFCYTEHRCYVAFCTFPLSSLNFHCYHFSVFDINSMKMERGFGSTHPCYPPAFTAEFSINSSYEANFNSIFNDPNLQPLLPLPSDPSTFNFFSQDFPSLPLEPQLPVPDLDSLYSSSLPTKIPDILPDSTQFLDFFNKPLPDLHSLEQPHRQPHFTEPSVSSSTRKLKRTRLDLNLSDNNPQTLDSIVQSFNSPSPVIPHSELARKRRQKLSDKTRCLQKLMPWDKKMDTGTMLQEAYKYIRFLEAQVSILQSMPISSSFASTEHNAPVGFDYGGLGRLNRQQLLQVLVNSPVAQTMLYSQGFCVFAYEQLVSLKKAKERKAVLQQFLFGN
ncbi:DNA binding-like protein [Theobroma cacao]|uniref:DNA binding-like protein n=1 Tax=Theobroma cacao TaxID=3641 RepID=A0A061E4F6_THECC|nr:DNA binding-like protein [Theobroma cacao]